MTSTSEIPAWLSTANNNNNVTTTTNDITTATTTKDIETGNHMTSIDIDTPTTAVKDVENNTTVSTLSNHNTCSKVMKCISLSISAFLFILFIASSIVQNNDTGGSSIIYLVFYALHAIVAGAYFFSHFLCNLRFTRLVTGLGTSMFIWSIVLIIISSIQLSNTTDEDDVTEEGGDNPDATKREEIAYEIAGAALGAISTIYHVCMAQRRSSTTTSA